ncbi:MAG: hypothetical protein HYV95_17455 [Opitutae bacterium]|nr:hypothetical protein [Opitutae bacterium]
MNSCCTIPTAKLNPVAAPVARPARGPFAALQRLIDTASFTAVDLTHVFFVDPDRPEVDAPRQTYCETR